MPPETDEKILPKICRLHYAHYKGAVCWFTVVTVPLTPSFLQFIRQRVSEWVSKGWWILITVVG